MSRIARRQFLLTAATLLAAPRAVMAQAPSKVHRVALVFFSAPLSAMAGSDPVHPLPRAFVHELRDLGYVEGRNLVLDRHTLGGKVERAEEVVAEALRLKPDVIVCSSNPITRAAKNATTSIPIVMAGNVAPVRSGLVKSLAHPGGIFTVEKRQDSQPTGFLDDLPVSPLFVDEPVTDHEDLDASMPGVNDLRELLRVGRDGQDGMKDDIRDRLFRNTVGLPFERFQETLTFSDADHGADGGDTPGQCRL